MGLPWLHKYKSAFMYGVGEDAETVSSRLRLCGTHTVRLARWLRTTLQSTQVSCATCSTRDSDRDNSFPKFSFFWRLGLTQDGKNALSNPQVLNSYEYASPIIGKDPTGRFW
jgi:hypothetical protein